MDDRPDRLPAPSPDGGNGGGVQARFDTRPGRLYRVQRTTAFTPNPAWAAAGSDLPGTGSTVTVHDPTVDGVRFYRLSVSLSP